LAVLIVNKKAREILGRKKMREKEKYHAQLDARIVKFGETLQEIKNKMEKRKEDLEDIQLDGTIRMYEKAKARLQDMKRTDESSWQEAKGKLDRLVDDIDVDLREKLAYFG
jgi:hypothetical protein